MIPYIQEVRSNIKGKAVAKVEGHYILVFGRNGSGKSSLMHAIELACFNQVFDAAGRDMKAKGHVNHLATSSLGSKVDTQVTLSDSTTLAWGTKVEPYRNAMTEAMSAVTGSTLSLLRFILKNTDRDTLVKVDYSRWDALVKKCGSSRKALLEGHEIASKALRDARGSIKGLTYAKEHVNTPTITFKLEEARIREERAKELQKAFDTGMRDFCASIFDSIEGDMLRYLPPGMPKFHKLGKEIRLGFRGRTVPSGAESVMLGVALAAALMRGPKLFLLPDRAYDPQTLGDILRVLRTIPDSVVWVQSTVMPENYDAKALGWNVIEL